MFVVEIRISWIKSCRRIDWQNHLGFPVSCCMIFYKFDYQWREEQAETMTIHRKFKIMIFLIFNFFIMCGGATQNQC